MLNIHPCSTEFQAEAKRLGLSGNQLIQKYKKEGIIKTDNKVDRDRIEKFANDNGYKNYKDYRKDIYKLNPERYKERSRINYYRNGGTPMDNNLDCNLNFGFCINEQLFDIFLNNLFEKVSWLHLNGSIKQNNINFIVSNPRKEFLDKHPILAKYFNFFNNDQDSNQEFKIALMGRCLEYGKSWGFSIDYNRYPDFFILVGWSERENKQTIYPINTWIFPRDAEIRKGNNYNNRIEFWRRDKFIISKQIRYSYMFDDYKLNINYQDRLNELWNKDHKDQSQYVFS